MPDTYWLIEPGSGDPVIPIDYTTQANPWPTPRRGQSNTYDCRFVPQPRTDYSTLSQPAITGYLTRYEAVRDYLEFSHAVTLTELNDGSYVFDESTVSELSPADSHFVGVEPPPSIDVRPFYAVVSGGTVTKTAANDRYRIDLELTHLGPQSDWPTRSSAREQLEA